MTDLTSRPASELAALIAARKASPLELAEACLERIEAQNPVVNAVVSLRDRSDILAEAKALTDAAPQGPLHGLPIAIKDLTDAKGLPTTHGSTLFANTIAPSDAAMTAAIRKAGALIIGKTNTPQFGLGSHTTNPVFGPTRNPYDVTKTSGGSSGGAAAALATRMLPIADGSDMMGSLRNPAAWNNVYGFRPSYGVVPQEPTGDSFLHQLATSGPMARTPRDLALLLQVQASAPRAPHREPLGTPNWSARPPRTLAWLGDWGGALPMEEGVLELCEAALKTLEADGCRIISPKPPFELAKIWRAWVTLRNWAVSCALGPDFDRAPETLNAQAIWEIEQGRKLSAADVHAASEIRSQWDRAFHAMEADLCALPSAQMFPFDHDLDWPKSVAGTPTDTYHRWMEVVIPVSLIGVPAVALPAGFRTPRQPMGLQVFGPRGSDANLLSLAEAYHLRTDWPGTVPPVVPATIG